MPNYTLESDTDGSLINTWSKFGDTGLLANGILK